MADDTRPSSSHPRATRTARAKAIAKPASRPRAKARAKASPRSGTAVRRATARRKGIAKGKPGPAPAPTPERAPLDVVVQMRPVQPQAQPSRAERLAARGTPAAAPAQRPHSPVAGRRGRFSRLRGLLSLGLLLGLVVAAVAALPATSQGNAGTIKVHDGTGADPDERNEPHVSGDAYVEGFNMAADGGDLLVYSWPPTGDMTLVLATNWTGDGADPAVHFLAGPFSLACGHYRVFAYNGAGPDDPTEPQPGGAKKKTFWVDCVPPEGSPPTPMACPTDLAAVANGDGSVTLSWTPAPGSVGTNVYRAEDGGDFEYLATVGQDVASWTDGTSVAGLGYEYSVTGLYGDQESQGCPVVEVTAIPELPTLAAVGLASGGGALALLLAVRRRKA